MKVFIAALATLMTASFSAHAGALTLNCVTDGGLSFSVATDVDEDDIGTASNYGMVTQLRNEAGVLKRDSNELRGRYKLTHTPKGQVKTIEIRADSPSVRAWKATIKRVRKGLMGSQNVYEGKVVEMGSSFAPGGIGETSMVCIDQL